MSVASSLPIRLHRFLKPGFPEQRVVVLSYYVLNGQPTTDNYSFWGLGWRDPNLARDASRYVAQVQVTTSTGLDPAAAERVLEQFVKETSADILALLPADPTGDATPD